MKNLYILFMILSHFCLNAQVYITDNNATITTSSDPVILHINNTSESSNVKGLGLSAVNNLTDLPYYNTPPSTIKENLRGMLLFVKATGETMHFDGFRWTKAFNIIGSNISRFQINSISTTNGIAPLSFNSTTGTYLNDPLRAKTNIPTTATELPKIYIRQNGTYRINIQLRLTSSASGAFSDRIGITLSVNGGTERTRLLETVTDFSTTLKILNLDTVLFLKQGEYFTINTVAEVGGTQIFTVTNNSYLTVEKLQ